ncbi:MAG: PQQ-dependent sugar dehydrogenase [Pseudomonadales bacterium]
MRKVLLIVAITFVANVSSAGYQLKTVAEGFNYPWSIAFLPDGELLVSMRSGELRRVSAQGEIGEPVSGTPETYVAGQGGYFDIVLDPNFAENRQIYLAYAGGTPEANATTVTRATLADNSFTDASVIFAVSPTKDTPQHYGGKMLFLPDNTLLLTTGDGFDYREAAHDTFSQLGKIIRINRDGSVPPDNPFADGEEGDPRVYSYGHRNPQGLVLDSKSGVIYMHEHGPKGGDELNRVEAGNNYGWPAVTYGINYSGALVSPLKEAPGVTQPLHHWTPSIAPSGLALYDGNMFPDWRGDLFVGALVDREVRRLVMEDGRVVDEHALFSELGARIRDVRVGPDGSLYILTDSDQGKIIRVLPEADT